MYDKPYYSVFFSHCPIQIFQLRASARALCTSPVPSSKLYTNLTRLVKFTEYLSLLSVTKETVKTLANCGRDCSGPCVCHHWFKHYLNFASTGICLSKEQENLVGIFRAMCFGTVEHIVYFPLFFLFLHLNVFFSGYVITEYPFTCYFRFSFLFISNPRLSFVFVSSSFFSFLCPVISFLFLFILSFFLSNRLLNFSSFSSSFILYVVPLSSFLSFFFPYFLLSYFWSPIVYSSFLVSS